MNRLQSPKSAIDSPLGFAESFRVHEPNSTNEFAAVSTPPPRNNSLRYTMLDVGCWMFGVHHEPIEYSSHSAPPSGWSGDTLDKPLTCPATIEPPQPHVFDQPSLSIPLSDGIFVAERFRHGADLWSAGAVSLRLCGLCRAIFDLWAVLAPTLNNLADALNAFSGDSA
jgi:hypothetical protein